MALNPNFSQTPKIGIGLISTANTNRDGTGTIVTVFTAGDIGSKIERVKIVATGNTTQGMVRLFLHDGVNARMLQEVPVSAITVSGTVPSFSADIDFSQPESALWIPKGWSLRAAPHNAEAFNVIAIGGDLS